eukprot:6167137-Amphidinium_carterae.1
MSIGVFPYDAVAPAPLDLRFAVQQTLRRTRNSQAILRSSKSWRTVLTVLMKWPDVTLPMRFISGFHTTGVLEQRVISHAPLVFARMAALDISPDAQFLWGSCPDGKQRRIDDAKAGHQNQSAAYSEKLAMCTAFQPALNARLVWEESQNLGISVASLQLHAGGEDLPNAYRHVPCHPPDLPLNVVAVQNSVDRQ